MTTAPSPLQGKAPAYPGLCFYVFASQYPTPRSV